MSRRLRPHISRTPPRNRTTPDIAPGVPRPKGAPPSPARRAQRASAAKTTLAPARTEQARPPGAAARGRPQRDPDPGFVAVGRVLAPFGLKGEVKVQPLTDNPKRFATGARMYARQERVTVAGAREAGGHLYVRFKGMGDRTSVERLRHALLQVPERDLPALPEGEYYRFQLLGLRVVRRDGSVLGTLEEVIETGANDVYRVRTADGGDALLAATDDVIVRVDLDAGEMVVDPPEWR